MEPILEDDCCLQPCSEFGMSAMTDRGFESGVQMIKIGQILGYLEAMQIDHKYVGRECVAIDNYSVPGDVRSNSILWVKDPKRIMELDLTHCENVVIVTALEDAHEEQTANYLYADNPKEVFFEIIHHYFAEKGRDSFLAKSSTIETNQIGEGVYIGHNCYIGSRVSIGDNVIINNNVVINGHVQIGNSTTIGSGVVIGEDGFGYYKSKSGQNKRVPHLGGVVIGSNVDIGANTCVDRGTLGNTIIGDNVKIDNLCHIAHNVVIEDNVSVVALSMIAGSVTLKAGCYVAPSASIMNQLTIGENSIVGLGAVVLKKVEDNVVVAGVPAKVIRRLVSE